MTLFYCDLLCVVMDKVDSVELTVDHLIADIKMFARIEASLENRQLPRLFC